MRIIGIDPGLRRTGWGVIENVSGRISHVANGVCESRGEDLATRLLSLFDQLTDVVARMARRQLGLMLERFYMTRSPACDPTTPDPPNTSIWLKLDTRFF